MQWRRLAVWVTAVSALALALAAPVAAPAAAQSVAPGKPRSITRRIATLAPEGSLWMNQLERGAKKIEELTEGRVKTKYYSGGSQGDEKAVVRKMRLRQLDGAALTSVGLGLIYSGIRVLELPFMWNSVEELDYVRAKMWPYFQSKFAERGFELLAPGDIGWLYLFSLTPLRTRTDLSAMKIWASQHDPMARRLFRNLGMDGVPLGIPEVLPSLSSGRIDATYASPLAAVALQWHSQVRYMSSEPLGYGIGGLVIRLEMWNATTIRDREVQLKIGRKLLDDGIRRVRRDNGRALEALKKAGLAIVETPPDVRRELRAQGEKMWKAMVGKLYTQEELDMALKYRAEYRAKHGSGDRRGQ